MRTLLIAAAISAGLIATPAAAQFGIYVGPAAPYGYYDAYYDGPAYDPYVSRPAYGYYGGYGSAGYASGYYDRAPVYGYASSYAYQPTYQPRYGYYQSYSYSRPMRRQYYGGPKWDW
jgi:hypothetical protein